MGSFSSLGIGLSFIFGCVLMGVIAELYYLLWWKKKREANANSSPTKKIEEFSFLFCWKKPTSFKKQELANPESEPEDLEVGDTKNLGVSKGGEEGVDLELMRLHNLCGPPRFLFSITEESKEDLESEDGRSRKGAKSLGSTPVSSPAVKSPAFRHGFNPLFESITEEDADRLRSSPPPTFKFLKDAEDKFIRNLLIEERERKRGLKNEGPDQEFAIREGREACFVKLSSQSAQVLPLSSSPTVH